MVNDLKERKQKKIKTAYFENKGLYGSPRLAVEITSGGTPVSRTTVALHMKEMNIKSKVRGKFSVTTDSSHKEPVCENLLDRQFNPSAPSMTWVSDITYIPTQEGFLYLTTIVRMKRFFTALNMVVKNRKPIEDMIFHSDRGVQYASSKTRNILASYKIRQSMSRKGNCWDNAVAESFFKTLETEMI